MLHLGYNIQLIRGLAELTQKELAAYVGKTEDDIKGYETKGVGLKPHIRLKIAELGGVTEDNLLNKKLGLEDITINQEKVEKAKKGRNPRQKHTDAQGLTIDEPNGGLMTKYINSLTAQIKVLQEHNELLKTNLASTLKLQKSIHDHLLALSWYQAHRAAGGNEKKAMMELSKINNKADEYRLVNEKTDKVPGKRRSKAIKVVP